MSASVPPLGNPAESKPARIRVQKFLASCGLGSRRACEEYITAGRVSVDGVVVDQLGATVDPSRQAIELDGEPLKIERKKYYVLNKPRGVVCTNRDPAGRPRVIDLFPSDGPRLFPVGRLDEESEGLIIVTNDGDFSQKLAHPKYRIFRTYHVHVAGVPNRPALESLEQGYFFTEGKFRVHSAKLIKKQGQSSHVELILAEGQNREVRRLLARIGHKVMRLRRVAFGPIQLGRLKRGEFRPLKVDELERLHSIVDRNIKMGPPPRESRPSRRPSGDGPAKPERGSRDRRERGDEAAMEQAAPRRGRRVAKQALVDTGRPQPEPTTSAPEKSVGRRGGKPSRTKSGGASELRDGVRPAKPPKPRRGAGRHRRSRK